MRGDFVHCYCSFEAFDFGVEGSSTVAGIASFAGAAGHTMTLSSLSFTTLSLRCRGGLLIPLAQRSWFVSWLMDTSSDFILRAAKARMYLTALGLLFSLGPVHIRRRLRS